MKKLFLVMPMLFACSSFAKPASYICAVVGNPKAALVAGEYFKMSVDDSFGLNANYNYPIQVESFYLGTCEGAGKENTNPLAEGYTGAVSIGGAQCAADGFDIFSSTGVGSLIQVDVGSEAVYYSCFKIHN